MIKPAQGAKLLEKITSTDLYLGRAPYNAPRAEIRRSYEGGSIGKQNANWQPPHRSGNAAISESWDLLTRRVRDLTRNEPTFRRARNQITRLVIGPGVQVYSDIESHEIHKLSPRYKDHDPERDAWFADESDEWFEHWATHEADVRGVMSWYEMQEQLFRDTVEIGNALLVRYDLPTRGGRTVPLAFQMVEWEQLDRSRDRGVGRDGNEIINGIEIDKNGRPVAYYIYDQHPFGQNFGGGLKSTRVLAERVIHYYIPDRISTACGISWFAAIVRATKDVDWYLANELQAAAIGALLTLVYKTDNADGISGFDDGTEDSDSRGNPLLKLGDAITATIGTDEEFGMAESNRPNRNADPFIQLMHRIQSMGTELSYIRLTGDLKSTSYTAARAAHLDDAAMAIPLQNSFARRVALPVRQLHNAQAAAMGLYESMDERRFVRDLRRCQQFAWVGVGREQLDPSNETAAALDLLRSGQSTLQEQISRRTGRHWKAVLRQKWREELYAQQLGLELDFTKSGQMATTGGGEEKPATRDEKDAAEMAEGQPPSETTSPEESRPRKKTQAKRRSQKSTR